MLTKKSRSDEILRSANPSGARKSRFAQDANGSGICLENRVLHALVVGAAAAFGDDPVNDLVGIGDVARLAVHAIRGVDFQLPVPGSFLGHFVPPSPTK